MNNMSTKIIHKQAIIDTSVLIVLYHLELLQYLNLFYNKVRIPRAVEKEFLTKNKDKKERNKRFSFLTNAYSKYGIWLKQCNDYDSGLIKLYLSKKNIDEGEAEAFAQNQAYQNIHEILLDEKNARKVAKKEKITHHGVLFILANLDIKYRLCNYFDAVEIAQNELKTFFSSEIVNFVFYKIKETN